MKKPKSYGFVEIIFCCLLIAFSVLLLVTQELRISISLGDNIAAWVQAIFSGGAIIAAVVLWRADANERKQRENKEKRAHLQSIVVTLRSEVFYALEAAEIRMETFSSLHTKSSTFQIDTDFEVPPEGLEITTATVYKAIAPELGNLPPTLAEAVVDFYSKAAEMQRVLIVDTRLNNLDKSALLKNIRHLMPRIRMKGELLLLQLDKFEKSGFEGNIEFSPSAEELKTVADKVGYPLKEVAAERGFQL